ncbi:MAG: hypothetical protein K0Q50_2222 [Vampirovibrio sp.]|nr:hypothetical protein [Vampirovibrio sp.]
MRRHNRKPNLHRRKAHSGQVVIEAIASIIIFTIMIALVMSISVYLYFQQALVTSAREGARQAALSSEIGSASTEQQGISNVQTYIQNEIQQLTGQSFDPGIATITVLPPSQSASQTPGQRDVTVQITWNMTNPIGISGLVEAFGADGSAFATIPVSAAATMRYEE